MSLELAGRRPLSITSVRHNQLEAFLVRAYSGLLLFSDSLLCWPAAASGAGLRFLHPSPSVVAVDVALGTSGCFFERRQSSALDLG